MKKLIFPLILGMFLLPGCVDEKDDLDQDEQQQGRVEQEDRELQNQQQDTSLYSQNRPGDQSGYSEGMESTEQDQTFRAGEDTNRIDESQRMDSGEYPTTQTGQTANLQRIERKLDTVLKKLNDLSQQLEETNVEEGKRTATK